MRKKVLFIVNGKVVSEETTDTTITKIEQLKWLISRECECGYDNIDVEIIDANHDYSEVDISVDGLIMWKETHIHTIKGIECCLKDGSDAFMDAVVDDKLHEYINFYW